MGIAVEGPQIWGAERAFACSTPQIWEFTTEIPKEPISSYAFQFLNPGKIAGRNCVCRTGGIGPSGDGRQALTFVHQVNQRLFIRIGFSTAARYPRAGMLRTRSAAMNPDSG